MKSDDILQLILGIGLTVIMLSIMIALPFVVIPDANKEIYIHILGVVEGSFVTIVSFYFGSSTGSKEKTKQLGTKPINMKDL